MISRLSQTALLSRSPLLCSFRPIAGPGYHASRASHTTSFPPAPTRPCPSCSTAIPLPLSPCPSCSALLSLPTNLSHHSMLYLSSPIASSAPGSAFDISQELSLLPAHGYRLESADLRSRWVRRQRELHPDKFSSRGDKTVEMARDLSGRVNEAYAVLLDDLRRAEYILEVLSRGIEETDKMDDPMLLAEILEAREELEDADSTEEIDAIRKANKEHVVGIINSLKEAFSEKPPNLDEAKSLAVQLRYWTGLEKAAKEKSV